MNSFLFPSIGMIFKSRKLWYGSEVREFLWKVPQEPSYF
jgi:hypothetical protein